jgi:TRAP-type mannitol/chloroaromatic compound transport system permease small subunit
MQGDGRYGEKLDEGKRQALEKNAMPHRPPPEGLGGGRSQHRKETIVHKLLVAIDTINEWAGRILCYLLLVMLVTIVYEVVARYFFNSPTSWVMEYNGYFLCGYGMLAGGYTLFNKAHVNVDIFYGRFGYRKRAIVDCFTWLLFFLFVGVVIYYGYAFAYEAYVRQDVAPTVLETPLYPIKTMIPVGASLLFLQGIAKFIRDIETAFTGKEPEDQELGGIFGRTKEE